MKKYYRWIIFGVVAVVVIALLLLVGMNKKLRQRLEALLLERLIKTKVQNLRDKAVAAKTKADSTGAEAIETEIEIKKIDEKIIEHKKSLQKGLEKRGLNAGEIANRFNNLGV